MFQIKVIIVLEVLELLRFALQDVEMLYVLDLSNVIMVMNKVVKKTVKLIQVINVEGK